MLSVSESDGDLIFATWVPDGDEPVRIQAQRAWLDIASVLDANGAVPLHERVFGSLSAAPCVVSARKAVAQRRCEDLRLMPTFVEGLPVDDGCGSLAGIHVVAARADEKSNGWLEFEGCTIGRLVESPNARFLSLRDTGALHSSRLAPTPSEDASAAISAAESALAGAGWRFADVCRTWYYLRDILDWYDGFDAVRSTAYERMGIAAPQVDAALPASTRIGGRGSRGGHCTLDLLAIRPKAGVRFERRHARLDLGSTRYVFVSGTASVDAQGASVHAGDFRSQALRTLDNVVTLLDAEGAGLDDVKQATAFVKRAEDVEDFNCLAEACGLWDIPVVATLADACREELLFELDATAALTLRNGPDAQAEP